MAMDSKTFLVGFLAGITLMGIAFHVISGQIRVKQEEMVDVHTKSLVQGKHLRGNLTICREQSAKLKAEVEEMTGKKAEITKNHDKANKDLEGNKKLIESLKKNITDSQKLLKEGGEKVKLLTTQLNHTKTEFLKFNQTKQQKGWF